MDVKYIIADSGGSSTTWAIVPDKGEAVLIHTESLHPKYALSESFSLSGLKLKFSEMSAPLYFYGAGCSSDAIQKQMEALLLQAGFPEVHVYPDTLAACRALYGNQPGWVAILGTGSILVQYNGMHIVRRVGGYGSLIGDEGGGFYFGKLVVQELLRTDQWEAEWTKLFQSREWILSKLAGSDAQQWISGLGAETAKMDFGFLHERNAKLFVELYCLPVSELNELSFIGTYGFEQAAVFRCVFEAHSIRVKKGIASPVKDLVDYHRMNEG